MAACLRHVHGADVPYVLGRDDSEGFDVPRPRRADGALPLLLGQEAEALGVLVPHADDARDDCGGGCQQLALYLDALRNAAGVEERVARVALGDRAGAEPDVAELGHEGVLALHAKVVLGFQFHGSRAVGDVEQTGRPDGGVGRRAREGDPVVDDDRRARHGVPAFASR